MSSSKRLIINCGASSVTAAVTSAQGDGLQVEKLVTEPLRHDYSNDDAWLDAVGAALKVISHSHKFSGRATFIIPGNQVLTKTIRIPHVEAKKRAQIIAFEAQQNIPYPLHEVVWDSQVVGDDGVETEVLFIACKAATINGFCSLVDRAGLGVEAISAATVLDYNALQYIHPDQSEDLLLINIGARSTNLLFRGENGFFVRNIALGGNTLTQNIADNLGQSFQQAEDIKHKFFAEDVDYDSEDAATKPLISGADAFMRRMSQEITRSIVNYRRQKKGAAPKRILLTGRGASLQGLAEKLSETQKVPVDFFDPLANVTLDGGIDEDVDVLRLRMSEIIGEAARFRINEPAGVNLLPEIVQKSMRFAARKPFQQKAEARRERAEAMREPVVPLQERQKTIRENAERAQALNRSIQRIEGLVNSKSNWIQFFAELQESLTAAEDVWLDELSVSRENPENGEASYQVVLRGQMLVRETAEGDGDISQEVLSRRIKRLQSSFEESEFIVDSKPPSITWTSLREGLNVLPFRINLVVDTAKPL
mgnify:CR=1 FL=1